MNTPVLPPYGVWLGVEVARADDGAPRFRLPFGQAIVGRPGFIQGGAIAGLLELAAIGTVLDAVKDEVSPPRVKPVTVTVDFMRGGRERETIAYARITRLGARVANVESYAWQESPDKPIASARLTLMLYREG
jgi:uncharacterized protein (TIGR00369 family)